MHGKSIPHQSRKRILWLLLTSAALLSLLSTGCASFNNSMSAAPERSGPPPYADDPEANGNPAKAWYN